MHPSPFFDDAKDSVGYNVIGFVTGNFGLSVACHNTIQLLLDSGIPVAAFDVEAGGGRSGHDSTYSHLMTSQNQAPYPVNLFHMNPPDIVNLLIDAPKWLDTRLVNVCVPFWELPGLPDSWVPVLESCDLVLCPSEHVMAAVRGSAPAARCIHFPQTVRIPALVSADRAKWGLPAESVVFLVAFDLGSDVDRKNPWDSIEAFRNAFGSDDSARLVIKVNNPELNAQTRAGRERLAVSVRDLKNVMLVSNRLTYAETMSLYESCDVLCSLHRAEGLGLHLLEAMILGKPVITTGWSGNMDFMDDSCACLVGYDLVPVKSSHPSYSRDLIGPGQVWAQPHVAQASEWMRRLADDADMRARIGAAAQSRALRTQTDPRRLAALNAIHAYHAEQSAIAINHEVRSREFGELGNVSWKRSTRRLAGRALRRLGLRK